MAGLACAALVVAAGLIVTSHSQIKAAPAPKQPMTFQALMQSANQDDVYPGMVTMGASGANAVQPYTVKGTVTDATTGKPVANANIGYATSGTTPSTSSATKTNASGQYTISSGGTINIIASRYTVNGTNPLYESQTKMNVSGSATVNFALKPFPVPGSRVVPANRAKNVLFVDYDNLLGVLVPGYEVHHRQHHEHSERLEDPGHARLKHVDQLRLVAHRPLRVRHGRLAAVARPR